MKQILFLLLSATLVAGQSIGQKTGKSYNPVPQPDGGYSNAILLNPGDTLFLNAKYTWSYIWIYNQHGTKKAPVYIMNKGGQTLLKNNNFKIEGCTNVKVLGTGTPGVEYGIKIQPYDENALGPGWAAFAVIGKSKNIEISNIYIRNSGIGLLAEQDAGCDPAFNYPNIVADSVEVHHCRFIRMWNQAMYIGNTNPDNHPAASPGFMPRPVTCDGVVIYPKSMRAGHFKIHDNYIDGTGRAGIQLSAVSEGISEIYNNTVKHTGMNGDDAQGAGIIIGAYTKAYIHHNAVISTYTWGIASLAGSGTGIPIRIEENYIDSAGYQKTYNFGSKQTIDPGTEPVIDKTLDWPYAIFVVTGTLLQADSSMFWIRNNRIGLRKSTVTSTNKGAAIGFADNKNSFHKTGNVICGNLNLDNSPANSVNTEGSFQVYYATVCDPPKYQPAGRRMRRWWW